MQMMPILYATLLTVIVLLAANFVRFQMSPAWNKGLFCSAAFIIIVGNTLIINAAHLSLALFLFVMICAFTFRAAGAWISSALCVPLIIINDMPYTWQHVMFLYVGYVAVGLISSSYSVFLKNEARRNHHWQKQLIRHAKELDIIRNIGSALQSTLETDKILHVILTAITAGHGLGFNRAMLFLLSEDRTRLVGKAAIGSLHKEQVINIWKITSREKMSLEDYIAHEQDAIQANQELIEHIRKTDIVLARAEILERAVKEGTLLCVDTRAMQAQLHEWFGGQITMDELGVVPLVNQGETIGVILVDNHVNQMPIVIDDMERLLTLANQAAMAIYNANLYKQTQEMAITDGLTGLHNQRFFEEMFRTVYNSTRKNQLPLSMLVIDIDYFKVYNDCNGHLAGNDLLVLLARLLKQSVRKEDLTFRYGGEEFVILLSATKKPDALRIAEKIRQTIETMAFPHEDCQPGGQLTVSIGVSSFPEDKEWPRELFEAADMALYEAKRRGRNQVVGYEEAGEWSKS